MTHDEFAQHCAHLAAAEWLRLGLGLPTHAVVAVTLLTGGPQISVQIVGVGHAPRVEAPTPAVPLPPLRDIEKAIYDNSPMPGKVPISIKKLAVRAGYCCNSYFREAVRRLIEMGLLVKFGGGIKRA